MCDVCDSCVRAECMYRTGHLLLRLVHLMSDVCGEALLEPRAEPRLDVLVQRALVLLQRAAFTAERAVVLVDQRRQTTDLLAQRQGHLPRNTMVL